MRKPCRLWKREEGVAILEMAMIMPVIAMIIFLIMDMGLFFFDYVSAQNAAREGARCGAVGYSDASVEARVIEAAGFSDPTNVDVTRGGVGGDIVVSADFDHQWLLPAGILGVPNIFTVTSNMRLETSGSNPAACGA